MSSQGNDDKKHSDPRVAGIATVGWVTLAALGISIPLTAIAGAYAGPSALALPLAIILGAGVMAVRIWSSGEKTVNRNENEKLSIRITELEERLANLEMIDAMEAHFAEKNRALSSRSRAVGKATTMGPPAGETES